MLITVFHLTNMFREIDIIKSGKKIKDLVADEIDLRLIVNEKPIATVKISPGFEEEFAIGHCLCEGLIGNISQVLKIIIDSSMVYVQTDSNFELSYQNYLMSDCISGWRAKIETDEVKVSSNLVVKDLEIRKNMEKLRSHSKVWRKTGGVHSVGLITKDRFLMVEDISRHVAIDKVIGLGAKEGVNFKKSYILTSGRLPGDMVIKVARVGIPIIASRTAPLTSGIECALKTNVTLLGFVRGRGMNVYTHSERLK